ncbi:hypothetical protein Plec18170_005953 [Paecilomyces lecythidis]
MARLTLTDDDLRVRKWLANELQKLDCSLHVDQMGNMFARQAGQLRSTAPMIAIGSHLDTQPRGGRYDGILGVMAGLEILRTMKEHGYKTQFDVGLVNWTKYILPAFIASSGLELIVLTKFSEEGARFPKSMCSSGVWAGAIRIQDAWNLRDIHDPSVTLRSELERLGCLGNVECSSNANTGFPLAAHFELHIEQGPILQETGRSLGVVQGAQGYRWLKFTVHGRDAHTGTTPFGSRKDPLLSAARMIAASKDIAEIHGALASTGVLAIPPDSSTNTIASEVTFTLDIRHPHDSVVHTVQDECLKTFSQIALQDGKGVTFDWTMDTDSPAVKFDKDCVNAVRVAAEKLVGPDQWMDMTSGAGHDSVYTSKRCPTAMIFVPCRDGVSHHPEEFCRPQDW